MPILMSLALLALVLWLAVFVFLRTSPKVLARGLIIAGIVVAAWFGLYLVVTGRVGAIILFAPLVMGIIDYFRRRRIAPSHFTNAGTAGQSGQASTIETEHLRMWIDHETGTMDGEVVQGPYQGRQLSDLTLDEAQSLFGLLGQSDADAARLLEAWLDRRFPDWRSADSAPPPPPKTGPMSREDALEILGLGPDADEDAIRSAHRRLMQANHPDHGGSARLAAQINQARDRLLGHPNADA